MARQDKYPRPAVTVDIAVIAQEEGRLRVLLVRRGSEPHKGRWALPGGFIEIDESLEAAARRELAEETGLKVQRLEQVATFGAVDRGPRGRVISVVWVALVRRPQTPKAGDDAGDAQWHDLDQPPTLAFDHQEVLKTLRDWLAQRARVEPIVFDLLPERFSFAQMRELQQTLRRRRLDPAQMRRQLLARQLVIPAGERRSEADEPLYCFDTDAWNRVRADGLEFLL